MKVPTGCAPIDDLLNGGVERGAITLVYGEGGSGKTNLCLQLARDVALGGKKVAYMDTEGVSMERLEQMTGKDVKDVLSRIIFYKPFSFDDQEKMTDEMIRVVEAATEIDLVIVDSATMYFRLQYSEREDARSSLTYQIVRLLTLARKRDIPVVVTSQVYVDIENEEIKSLGGSALFHNAKAILFLTKAGPHKRRAVIMKHRALHEGRSAIFQITNAGLVEPGKKDKEGV